MILPSKQVVLKLLIAAGAVGIVASIFVQYGKPFLKERVLEKHDLARIHDLDALNQDISALLAKNRSVRLGTEKTIYLSLPSSHQDCGDLDLPSLTNGWAYHCTAKIDLAKMDGGGWLPLNLQEIQSARTTLPIDPSNQGADYYAFSLGTSSTYSLSALLDSKKYTKEVAQQDKGISGSKYEVGTSFFSWANSQSLLGYWPLEKQGDSTLADRSGNNNNGTILGGATWSAPGMHFDGQNFIVIKNSPTLSSIGKPETSYSLVLWVKALGDENQSLLEKWDTSSKYPFALRIEGGSLLFAVYDGTVWTAASKKLPASTSEKWTQIIAVRDVTNNLLKLYLNGILVSQTDLPISDLDAANSDSLTIGSRGPRGLFGAKGMLSNVAIYKKAFNDHDALLLFSQSNSLFSQEETSD